jgi:hypothetical protein
MITILGNKNYCIYCNCSIKSKSYIHKHIKTKKCQKKFYKLYRWGIKEMVHPYMDKIIEGHIDTIFKKKCVVI